MPIGTVKKLFADRGFGFIEREGDTDLWFHHNAVIGGLKELVVGDRVSFDIGQGQRGPKAIHVRVLKPAV